jgi:hypothetical protein
MQENANRRSAPTLLMEVRQRGKQGPVVLKDSLYEDVTLLGRMNNDIREASNVCAAEGNKFT